MNDMLPHDSGEDGVWVEVALDSLEKGHYRHAPFGEAYRPFFERMSAMFADMGMGSPEHWEDGFRRDRRPEREMGFWKQMAEFYEHFMRDGNWSIDRKRELFDVLMTCMSDGPKSVLRRVNIRYLSRPQVKTILNYVTKTTNGRLWPMVIGLSTAE